MTATVEHEADAERIATALLERRVVACVQTSGPITSRYWWRGELATSTEYVIVAKTTAARAADACELIVEHHPYDVPEVLVAPVLYGHQPYLRWVTDNVD